MRERFQHFYPLTDDDLDAIASEAIIALDANALLHAYRLTPPASDAWIELLAALADRIWVPHRAAFEYQRNRVGVVASQNRLATEIEKDVEKALGSLRSDVSKRRAGIKRSRVFEWAEVDDALEHAGDSIRELIERARDNALDLDAAAAASDPIHVRLTDLLNGRVGDAPDADWIKTAVTEANERYAARVPPGWGDEDKEPKPGDKHRPFGDYFVWKELLEYAAERGLPAVLVSEDRKEDWLRKDGGRTMGPLPQLREEFDTQVGQTFWLYSVAGLMRMAESFGAEVDAAAVQSAELLEEEASSDDKTRGGTSERILTLVQSLERFNDHAAVGEGDLRREITELLGALLADELRSEEKPLSGPGAGIEPEV